MRSQVAVLEIGGNISIRIDVFHFKLLTVRMGRCNGHSARMMHVDNVI